jgi:hypothetical protein
MSLNIDQESLAGVIILGIVFVVLIMFLISGIQNFIYSLYSIPSNKKDQLFTVEKVETSNRGKPVPCANEYDVHYILHIKVTWRSYARTILHTEMSDYASDDGTYSCDTVHFLTKEEADEAAIMLSKEAQGLIIDDSKTVVELS